MTRNDEQTILSLISDCSPSNWTGNPALLKSFESSLRLSAFYILVQLIDDHVRLFHYKSLQFYRYQILGIS